MQDFKNYFLVTHENFVWSRNLNCPEKLMKHFFFKILGRIQWYKSHFIICLDLEMRTIPSLRSKWSLETPFTIQINNDQNKIVAQTVAWLFDEICYNLKKIKKNIRKISWKLNYSKVQAFYGMGAINSNSGWKVGEKMFQ